MAVSSLLVVESSPSVLVAVFPPSWLRVVAGEPRTSAEVFALVPSAELAVNGPMYATGTGPRYLLRDRREGVDIASRAPSEGVSVWVDDSGQVGAAYGTPVPASAVVAVQGWPSLVVDGQVSAHNVGTNSERVRRIGLGVTVDGSVIVVGLVGTMTALAERLRAEGAAFAGYLDGGSAYEVARSTATGSHRLPGWVLAARPSSRQDAATSGALAPLVLLGFLAFVGTPKR